MLRGEAVTLRPRKTADKFHISASTLRNYEAKGLIPPSARSANGYRIYTERHEAYLACIQAMSVAFGMEVTTTVLIHLQKTEWDIALWIVREKEIILYEERERLAGLIRELELYTDGTKEFDREQLFNIYEASLKTGVPKSTIRYWEKEGVLTVERNPANGYRLYDGVLLFKIRLMQVLQSCVYSEETVALKRSLKRINSHQVEEFLTYAHQMSAHLNKTLLAQVKALSRLYEVIEMEDLRTE
ncbi:HTH-type transcriptional regulator AdhR [compost metagenome]